MSCHDCQPCQPPLCHRQSLQDQMMLSTWSLQLLLSLSLTNNRFDSRRKLLLLAASEFCYQFNWVGQQFLSLILAISCSLCVHFFLLFPSFFFLFLLWRQRRTLSSLVLGSNSIIDCLWPLSALCSSTDDDDDDEQSPNNSSQIFLLYSALVLKSYCNGDLIWFCFVCLFRVRHWWL